MNRLFVFLFTLSLAAPLAAQAPKAYTAAIVIEPTTGRVLFEDNAHAPLPTASMAKMMTLLITLEKIRDGELKLDSPVTISAKASKMGGSQIYAKQGQVFPVQTLLATTMIQSANDAAQALAEKVGGSTEAFADLMNQRAQSLGLKESTFYDPHGLPNPETGKDDVMSAHDLAVLGIELMKYPLMRQYAAMQTMPFSNGTFTSGLTNPNHLLRFYDGADGIKTGYTVPAGFCVTASAHRGNMQLVCVVMGSKQAKGPEGSFEQAARLMTTAFNTYKMVDAVKKGQTVGQVTVTNGTVASVPAVAGADAKALVKRGEEKSVQVAFSGSANAPVRAGQPVGTIVVKQGGQVIAKVPALAGAASEQQPWWKKFWPF
jgi:D-alanyl-D-alanine carboxypeptidase (penicillin-binding protein 5/6)